MRQRNKILSRSDVPASLGDGAAGSTPSSVPAAIVQPSGETANDTNGLVCPDAA